MSSRFDNLFKEKKPDYAIMRIRKPKWLMGVTVERKDDHFRINLWKSGHVIVKDNIKFKSVYKGNGERKKNINMLGDNTANFTARIKGFDINQCFSLYKPVLLNRIEKEGSDGELFIPYEEGASHDILIHRTESDDVSIQATVGLGEELIFNGMIISMKQGPDSISRLYGAPDYKVKLFKNNLYQQQRSVDIGSINFKWGDSDTRYEMELFCDFTSKMMIFEIIVK